MSNVIKRSFNIHFFCHEYLHCVDHFIRFILRFVFLFVDTLKLKTVQLHVHFIALHVCSGQSVVALPVGRDSIPVRRPDSQSREPGFKSHCGRFEPLASLITPRCHSSLSCINEWWIRDSGGYVNE